MKQKLASDWLAAALPNREMLKTASPEAKRAILHRMAFCLIRHDKFLREGDHAPLSRTTGRENVK